MGLVLLLMVLVACGIVDGKENDNKIKSSDDTENELSNDELINMAIEEFKSNTEWNLFSSTCSENASNDEIREATNIEIWDDGYIKISVDTEIKNDNALDGSTTYEAFYKLDDENIEETQSAEDIDVQENETIYTEENDGVLEVTKTTQCD